MTARTVVRAMALLLAGAAWLGTATAGPPTSATVKFGIDAGSPFPPPSGHDQSGHARDTVVPGTVVIGRGGSVTFEVAPFHNPAVYAPGTLPKDIEVSPTTLKDISLACVPVPLEDFVIDDPDGRIAQGAGQSCAPFTWTTPAGTFDQPGRYLVICTSTPHFRIGMWGWVIVQ